MHPILAPPFFNVQVRTSTDVYIIKEGKMLREGGCGAVGPIAEISRMFISPMRNFEEVPCWSPTQATK